MVGLNQPDIVFKSISIERKTLGALYARLGRISLARKVSIRYDEVRNIS